MRFRQRLLLVCEQLSWQVRMSPDNMKAFILWSGLPDSEDRLEQTLQTK